MNIDAEIQEILLRSSPVNDNDTQNQSKCNPNIAQTNSGINIVGNNNIIVASSLFTSMVLAIVFLTYISYFR
jgi:hypothetical protein